VASRQLPVASTLLVVEAVLVNRCMPVFDSEIMFKVNGINSNMFEALILQLYDNRDLLATDDWLLATDSDFAEMPAAFH
jgi:hypothetical protein